MRILYVEDNGDNVFMLKGRLIRAGYAVSVAVDGGEGVAMAIAELPDLILMDMSLPVLDGWEATRRLKAEPATKHVAAGVLQCGAHTLAALLDLTLGQADAIECGQAIGQMYFDADERRVHAEYGSRSNPQSSPMRRTVGSVCSSDRSGRAASRYQTVRMRTSTVTLNGAEAGSPLEASTVMLPLVAGAHVHVTACRGNAGSPRLLGYPGWRETYSAPAAPAQVDQASYLNESETRAR